MYGNGWPGPTASGVSTGIDLAVEKALELGELLRRGVVDRPDPDALGGERGAEVVAPQARLRRR